MSTYTVFCGMPMLLIETDQAIKGLSESLGKLKKDVVADIISKSLNSAMTKARKAAYDEIKQVYNIRQISDITSKLKGQKATPGRLETKLFADRRGLQLAYFQPAQESTGKKRISVEVRKGKRETLKSAFYAKANSGKGNEIQSIFARGAYKGPEFEFREKRAGGSVGPDLPIGLLRSTSPLDMLRDQGVQDRVNDVAAKAFEKSLTSRIKRILAKQGQGND